MKKATYTVLYNRRNKLDKKGRAPVEILVTHNRESKIIPTGVKVEPADWNTRTKKVEDRHMYYIDLNQVITDLLYKLEAYELKLIHQNRSFNLSHLTKLNEEPEEIYFTEFWERMAKEDRTLKEQTRKNHLTHLNHL